VVVTVSRLKIVFGQTWLHKTNDFGHIQNLFDQNLGKNATTTGACLVHVKERDKRFEELYI
jgi:hypothetical protein